MANLDLELLRLEKVLRLARDRLALIIGMVPDPALLRAAEGLCAEATVPLFHIRLREYETE